MRKCGFHTRICLNHTTPLTPQALLGRGCVGVPGAGQVAPRFPQALPEPVGAQLCASLYAPLPGSGPAPATAVGYFARCGDTQTQAPHGGWHIDGMDSDRVGESGELLWKSPPPMSAC